MNLIKARRKLERYPLLKRVVLGLYRFSFIGFNRMVLAPLERLPWRDDGSVPIFIVGAPRSGTTLVYQAVTDYFDIGYFSNMHRLLFGFPALAEWCFNASRKKAPSDYTSYYGYIGRLRAPSEGDEYWNRFFRKRPAYASPDDVNAGRMARLKRSIGRLATAAKRPVVFKNLNNSVRMEPLLEYLPRALFIVVKRDVVDNAHSILKARKELTGSYRDWFSVEPEHHGRMRRLAAYKQPVEQIRGINAAIDEARRAYGPGRFLDVDYEAFCKDPVRELSRMSSFFARHGVRLGRRYDIPARFKVRKKVAIDKCLYERMASYARKS